MSGAILWEPDQKRQFQREIETNSALAAEVEGMGLLHDIEGFISRFVVLPAYALLPVGLWAVSTHLASVFDVFPYLSLSSPTARCGKTRLLEVLEFLVARPWRGTAPTEAALFRFIEANQPTLLLDEVEGLAKRHASERDSAVLAILNAGYKRGQTVPRCVGKNHALQNFHVFGPKAFACIGHLPDTLRDRSIVVPMQRRGPGDSVARFRFERARRETIPIRTAVERTVHGLAGEIQRTYAESPDLSFLTDRDEELFAPLFAVCAVLAPGRIGALEKCAKVLCEGKAGDAIDDSLPLRLLHDIRNTWPQGQVNWLTKEILSTLAGIDDSPWSSECGLTARRLARILRPFDVFPRQVKTPSGEGKGYVWDEVERAISRYGAPEKETSETRAVNIG
jgi:hypothetical protein